MPPESHIYFILFDLLLVSMSLWNCCNFHSDSHLEKYSLMCYHCELGILFWQVFIIFCVLGDPKNSSASHFTGFLWLKKMHQSQRIFFLKKIITCRQYLGSNRLSKCCMIIKKILFSSLTSVQIWQIPLVDNIASVDTPQKNCNKKQL